MSEQDNLKIVIDRAQVSANKTKMIQYVFPTKYAMNGYGFTAYPSAHLNLENAKVIKPMIT